MHYHDVAEAIASLSAIVRSQSISLGRCGSLGSELPIRHGGLMRVLVSITNRKKDDLSKGSWPFLRLTQLGTALAEIERPITISEASNHSWANGQMWARGTQWRV